MFPNQSQLMDLAQSLDPRCCDLAQRREALRQIISLPVLDTQTCEAWTAAADTPTAGKNVFEGYPSVSSSVASLHSPSASVTANNLSKTLSTYSIRLGIYDALADEDEELNLLALKFVSKAFTSTLSNVKECYVLLADYLEENFTADKITSQPLSLGLDINKPEILKLLRAFSLLHEFHKQLPHIWVRYPEMLMKSLMDRCLALMMIGCLPTGVTFGKCITPLHLISLLDPRAEWISEWTYLVGECFHRLSTCPSAVETCFELNLEATAKKKKTSVGRAQCLNGSECGNNQSAISLLSSRVYSSLGELADLDEVSEKKPYYENICTFAAALANICSTAKGRAYFNGQKALSHAQPIARAISRCLDLMAKVDAEMIAGKRQLTPAIQITAKISAHLLQVFISTFLSPEGWPLRGDLELHWRVLESWKLMPFNRLISLFPNWSVVLEALKEARSDAKFRPKSENTPQAGPKSLLELIDSVIMLDSPTKLSQLCRPEETMVFGLRFLSILVSSLDTFLLLESNYGVIAMLLNGQRRSAMAQDNADGTTGRFLIDEGVIERNYLLVNLALIKRRLIHHYRSSRSSAKRQRPAQVGVSNSVQAATTSSSASDAG
ncbi:unnamed protein product [Mesocestoides corti]|uniref:Uncharacterized protein n=1 Tax=Mesocestoides corti TaxID=53468 RepID=A0A0R3U1Q6_MESCO|nr:unnamed protein product [Mesocestoides corti]